MNSHNLTCQLICHFSEEIGVREHLYTTAYQEAIALFGKINQLEPQLAELVDVFRSAEGLHEDFDLTEKLIGEINSLAIWYSTQCESDQSEAVVFSGR